MSSTTPPFPPQDNTSPPEKQPHPLQSLINTDPTIDAHVKRCLLSRIFAEQISRQAIINAQEEKEEQDTAAEITKRREEGGEPSI